MYFPSLDISIDNLRKSAILYTHTYSRSLSPSHDTIGLAKFLFSQLAESILEINLRRYIIHTLVYLVGIDKNSRIKNVLYQEFVARCRETVVDWDNLGKVIFVALAAQMVLLASVHNTKELGELIRATIMDFVAINLRVYQYAVQYVDQQDRRQELVHILEILKLYSTSFKLYIKKICYSDLQTVKYLFQHNLCTLINKIWQFGLPQNLMPTKLLHMGRLNDWSILQQYHSIKADYMQSLGLVIRTVFQYFKQPVTLASHEIVSKPAVIEQMITALSVLHLHLPYPKIKSTSLIKLIQQTLNTLIICVRYNCYYPTFVAYKKPLIQDTLFNLLAFSPQDFCKYINDPNELINQIMQVMQMDSTTFINNRGKEYEIMEVEDQDIQCYTTMKTVAATMLGMYCKNIDGTLGEIVGFIQKMLIKQDSNFDNGSKFPNSLLLLILGILRDLVCDRSDDKNVLEFLTRKLQQSTPPHSSNFQFDAQSITKPQNQQHLSYLLTIITIQKYLSRTKAPPQPLLSSLFKITTTLLSAPLYQPPKLAVYSLISILASKDSAQKYSLQCTKIVSGFLTATQANLDKILELLFNLFKFRDEEIAQEGGLVGEVLEGLRGIVEREIDRMDLGDGEIVNKCWNIVSDVCQNERFVGIGTVCEQIEATVVRLSQFVDRNSGIQFQEHVFVCINSLIEHKKQVTDRQLRILGVIYKLFCRKGCRFQSSFETLCLMLEYGANKIKTKADMMRVLLQMAVMGMNIKESEKQMEIQCCRSVLLLQNLIICCHQSLNKQIWHEISNQLTKKLPNNPQPISSHINSNIIASLSLVLLFGSNSLTNDEYNIILSQVLRNRQYFTDRYTNKMVTIALCDIFKRNPMVLVLEGLIDVIKVGQKGGESNGKKNHQHNQSQYQESINFVKNSLTHINENSYFKSMINSFKLANYQAFEAFLKELPVNKLEYLKEFLSIAKINNEERKIFRIKR